MEVKKESPYLPKSKFKYLISTFKTNVAYRVWRRKLKTWGRFGNESQFKLLDVGCGAGHFLRCAEKWFPNAEIYGLDIDASVINFVGTKIKRAKIIHHDGQDLPFPDGIFDIVSAFQVIEHLEKPALFFSEANRILNKDGYLIMATPNPIGIPAILLGKKWQGYRYDHISLRTPYQWRKVIKDFGFHVLEDGTILLTGFKILQKIPFALIN